MGINPLQIPGYAAPQTLDFSVLANLPKIYEEARNKQTLADLGKGLADGSLDYKQAAGMAAGAGKLDVALNLMKLGEEKQQQADFTSNFGKLLGGDQPAAQPRVSSPMGRQGNSVMPGLDEGIATASQKYGVDPNYLRTTAQIESGGGRNLSNPNSSAGGPFQFVDSTARQYGLTNKNDPTASADAAARLAVDNRAALSQALGREPTNGELYLAHQQGAAGAIKLLANPDAPAVQVVGQQAVINNGGSPAMTAAQFASGFTRKFDGQTQTADNSVLPPNARPVGPASAQQPDQTQPTPRTNPLQNNIPALMYIMSAPGASAGQRDMAKTILTEAIKTPDNLKAYDFYQKQETANGRQPLSFFDYTIQEKRAGATAITNDMRGENSYATTVNKHYADSFVDTQKQGANAGSAITNLQVMDRLISNPNFYSGSGGDLVLRARKLATSLGVADADKAAPGELFQKLSSKVVLDAAGGSLGTGFSNADRDFLQGTVANLGNTPEGNKAIIQLGIQVEKRKQEVAKLARDYAKENGGRIDAGFDERLAQWAAQNPLIDKLQGNPLFRQQAQGQPKPAVQQSAPKAAPQVGAVEQGYRFKGGDPSKQENWERAQ